MRTPRFLLPLALLAVMHPASHASIHQQQSSPHQHTLAVHQSTIAFRAPRYRSLNAPAFHPETVNPPTRTTVFSYVVTLIRGLFSRAW